MTQDILLKALERGAFASLSDEAQTDTSTLSSLIKSVRITAKKDEIVFESATALVASRYVQPITDNVVLKEEGTVMVPAKELYDWIDRQGNCMIGLRSKDFDKPKVVNASGGDADEATKASIRKIGSLELVSQDVSKNGSKWTLDNYAPDQVPSVDFDIIPTPLFIAPLEQLNEGIKNIGFSAMTKDSDHLFDSISFQHKDEKMYMLTTDCSRCALWHLPSADKITMDGTITEEQMEKNGLKGAWKSNLLVPSKLFTQVCKLASNTSPIAFHREDAKNRVYVSQPGFIVRMASAEKTMAEKFPPLDIFLIKKYVDLCSIPAGILSSRLNTVSIVNKNAILFIFSQDKLLLKGISECGHAPCKATLSPSNLTGEFKKVWNVKHLLDILKVAKGDEIKLMIPDGQNKDSLKLIYPDQPNASYYVMSVERSKYNLNDEE